MAYRPGPLPDGESRGVTLQERYRVSRACHVIGSIAEQQSLYTSLQTAGFTLVFKEVTYQRGGKPKGNVDAELVLRAMIELPNYEGAVLVRGDGDFASLVRFLYEGGTLARVLSPNRKGCSALVKRAAREKLDFLEEARANVAYKR